jgi:glycine/D-amino acid oxidase-like deaminating enzyme
MKIDYLVIGQGVSGTFLAKELDKAGCSFIVIDELKQYSASRVASGIINPVTGRRMVKTWIIDELLPFARQAYAEMEAMLGISCISPIQNIDFFPTPQMRLAFLQRLGEDGQYLSLPPDEHRWQSTLSYDFGFGLIEPCYLINLQQLLPAYRKWLLAKQLLREETFNAAQLITRANGIEYQDISAGKIIFCNGIEGQHDFWFRNLPFAPNKGEVLLIECKELPGSHIYKKGLSIVPWQEGVFWVGSSHEWQYENDEPTTIFRQKTEAQLRSFLKIPFKTLDHWAAVRPATLERRPFVGFHPQFPSIGIFNGMGTKGCSLAPYFAQKLVHHLAGNEALPADVDVQRFTRILARNT